MTSTCWSLTRRFSCQARRISETHATKAEGALRLSRGITCKRCLREYVELKELISLCDNAELLAEPKALQPEMREKVIADVIPHIEGDLPVRFASMLVSATACEEELDCTKSIEHWVKTVNPIKSDGLSGASVVPLQHYCQLSGIHLCFLTGLASETTKTIGSVHLTVGSFYPEQPDARSDVV